jgi:hypothetical protein
MARARRDGPSQELIAWRRFLFETLRCIVLIGAIVMITVRASENMLTGVAIGGPATAVSRTLWRRW